MFVNSDPEFQNYLDLILSSLNDPESSSAFYLEKESIKRFEHHAQVFITDSSGSDIRMKIDFVNDISMHYGNFEHNNCLGKIDGWENILSNKITAIFRFEPKDVADIWVIAKNKSFNWETIIRDAKSKEAGVEPEIIFNILNSFPAEKLNLIKWTIKPHYETVKSDLSLIAGDIFYAKDNSLFS